MYGEGGREVAEAVAIVRFSSESERVWSSLFIDGRRGASEGVVSLDSFRGKFGYMVCLVFATHASACAQYLRSFENINYDDVIQSGRHVEAIHTLDKRVNNLYFIVVRSRVLSRSHDPRFAALSALF